LTDTMLDYTDVRLLGKGKLASIHLFHFRLAVRVCVQEELKDSTVVVLQMLWKVYVGE
jgi:hypothetical protein